MNSVILLSGFVFDNNFNQFLIIKPAFSHLYFFHRVGPVEMTKQILPNLTPALCTFHFSEESDVCITGPPHFQNQTLPKAQRTQGIEYLNLIECFNPITANLFEHI